MAVKHREAVNQRRRERYDSDARKRNYYENRDAILQKCREDKAVCPLCCIEYHRPYLRTHLVSRHRLEASEVERLFNIPKSENSRDSRRGGGEMLGGHTHRDPPETGPAVTQRVPAPT